MAEGSKTSVTPTSTEIIAAGDRRGFIIHNPGTEDLWCKLGETAVVGEGFVVKGATSVALAYEGEWNGIPTISASYNLAVNGIYSSETNNVAYQTL